MSDKKGDAMSSSGSGKWGWTKNVTSVHLQWGIIVFTLLGVLVLSIAKVAATPLAIAGVAILILLRFNDISDVIVEGFGAKVSLGRVRTATKEANEAAAKAEAAIEGLKEMAVTTSLVSLMEGLVGDGSAETFSRTIQLGLRKRQIFVEGLRRLDFSQDQIERILTPSDGLLINRLVSRALIAMEVSNADHTSISDQANAITNKRPFDMERIKKLLEGHASNERSEALIELAEVFAKTGDVDTGKLDEAMQKSD